MLVEFPNETSRSLSDELQNRLSFQRSQLDLELKSQRVSRSEMLRDAHIHSVKERAARETQRADEAQMRRRRREALCKDVQNANGMPTKARALSHRSAAALAEGSGVCSTPRPVHGAAGAPSAAPPMRMSAPLPLGISVPLDPMANVSPSGNSPRRSQPPGSNSPRRSQPPEAKSPIASLGLRMTSLAPLETLPPVGLSPRSAQSPRRAPEMPTIAEDPREEDFSPDRPPPHRLRAFERTLFTVETTTGVSRLCYEIRWLDGTVRRMYA
jgi:hypothetical protein